MGFHTFVRHLWHAANYNEMARSSATRTTMDTMDNFLSSWPRPNLCTIFSLIDPFFPLSISLDTVFSGKCECHWRTCRDKTHANVYDADSCQKSTSLCLLSLWAFLSLPFLLSSTFLFPLQQRKKRSRGLKERKKEESSNS